MKNQGSRSLPDDGQSLLNLLVSAIPRMRVGHPATFMSYQEAVDGLNLVPDAPEGPTAGITLQLNGLNSLAQWINRQRKLPRITGLIVSRQAFDEQDGIRRPPNVPGKGFFKEYRKDPEDWQWWLAEAQRSLEFDWTPYVSLNEQFTDDEIRAASVMSEGRETQVTKAVRERSKKLLNLAREHFRKHSSDGKLHCTICNWSAPELDLCREIVEIHHAEHIHTYPKSGKKMPFELAIKLLSPICPNCHRVLHAKAGGGSFTIDELHAKMNDLK